MENVDSLLKSGKGALPMRQFAHRFQLLPQSDDAGEHCESQSVPKVRDSEIRRRTYSVPATSIRLVFKLISFLTLTHFR